MKVRKGFVSNSSSSSFVIVIKPTEKCECCGRSDPDILEAIAAASRMTDCETGIDVEGKEEVIKYINGTWGEKDAELIEKIKAVSSDCKVAVVSISYHDQVMNEMLNNSKNIIFLHRDN